MSDNRRSDPWIGPPEADTPARRLETIKRLVSEGKVEIGNAAAIDHQAHPERDATATARAFAHEQAVGLVIQWSIKGVGFGELTIVRDRATGEWRVDDEHMGPDSCAKIFEALAARFQT